MLTPKQRTQEESYCDGFNDALLTIIEFNLTGEWEKQIKSMGGEGCPGGKNMFKIDPIKTNLAEVKEILDLCFG